MMITMTNEFHGTSVRLRTEDGWLSKRQVARARKTLCPVVGCTCGGELGERGQQDYAVINMCMDPRHKPVMVGTWEDGR